MSALNIDHILSKNLSIFLLLHFLLIVEFVFSINELTNYITLGV